MGEPSTRIPMRPSSIFAHRISGFSVVPACLKTECGRSVRNCAIYEESGTPSIAVSCMRAHTFFTRDSSAIPFRYATHTAVPLCLPTVSISNCRFGVLKRRRIRLLFVLTSSINPSRGPLTVIAVCGSITARSATFFVPKIMAPAIPSINSAGFPERISKAAVSASSASFAQQFFIRDPVCIHGGAKFLVCGFKSVNQYILRRKYFFQSLNVFFGVRQERPFLFFLFHIRIVCIRSENMPPSQGFTPIGFAPLPFPCFSLRLTAEKLLAFKTVQLQKEKAYLRL